MRGFLTALLALVLPSSLIQAQEQPPTAPPEQIAGLEKPKFPFASPRSPQAPTALAIIACRVDDLTGQPGRHDPAMAARGWRDLEPHVVFGELQCKRYLLPLDDAAVFKGAKPLTPNFGKWDQCARVAAGMFPTQENNGWAPLAAGCPTPITDLETGEIVGWKLPECPSKINGKEGITCKFDESVI